MSEAKQRELAKLKTAVNNALKAIPVERRLQEIKEICIAGLEGRSRYQVANTVLDIAEACNTPYIFISQRGHVRDQAAGLETGMSFGLILPDTTPKPKRK